MRVEAGRSGQYWLDKGRSSRGGTALKMDLETSQKTQLLPEAQRNDQGEGGWEESVCVCVCVWGGCYSPEGPPRPRPKLHADKGLHKQVLFEFFVAAVCPDLIRYYWLNPSSSGQPVCLLTLHSSPEITLHSTNSSLHHYRSVANTYYLLGHELTVCSNCKL